jgi:hypothetical protein
MQLTGDDAPLAYIESLYPAKAGELLFPHGPWVLTPEMRKRYHKYARQAKQRYQQVANGKVCLIDRLNPKTFEPDLAPLSEPLWYRIQEHQYEAKKRLSDTIIAAADDADHLTGVIWHHVVNRIVQATILPAIDADALQMLLETRLWRVQSTPLSAEIARLSATSLAQELLAELRRDFPKVNHQAATEPVSISGTSAAPSANDQPQEQRVSVNDPRDKWLYEQRLAGTSFKKILLYLKRNKHRWGRLNDAGSVRKAINRYCDRHQLPLPPLRRRSQPAAK